MLNTIDQIFINKYGQGLISIEPFKVLFTDFKIDKKREYLNGIMYLILQSKPNNDDIDIAIIESNLKPSYTPCVLLKKGITKYQLEKIIMLIEKELDKVLLLFMNLFKIAYFRRFIEEKNDSNKWWYWDLSLPNIESKILKNY
ncbi:DUF5958 family protein [Chryseobacterium sp. JJR-5R]|uniref:DUF5958 family protein n=1 Tax=Chryseobacterium sp. JJR-5R TaxID=3093923 RepID=UPI002A74ECDD|nr:DUF5958 family protein [Chryseobacterium sp. JJR-5R]WPO84290.1 DUF5958 family protein [Chryseobacterium sp. JJR-5R]